MANSNIIHEIKSKVVKAIISDDDIVQVIDSPSMNDEDWDASCIIDKKENDAYLSHIFTSWQNPDIIENAITFLCILVDIPETYDSIAFNKPRLTIYIYSHNEHMRIDNIIGVVDNRNDYLSILLDRKFNGSVAGIGTLSLKSNVESAYSKDFLARKMVFETIDLNKSLCDVE